MTTDWTDIDAPPPHKRQRQALYKFGIKRATVHALAPSEAADMLAVLSRMASRQAATWRAKAQTAEELLA